MAGKRPIRIVLTGPESTAKSSLSVQLASHFKGKCIPEFAREYIAKLDRPYVYDDVVSIAQHQLQELKKSEQGEEPFWFFDTGLIITKVWFDVKYKQVPGFIEDALQEYPADLYLLCYPDIDWQPDPLRENPDIRQELLYRYKSEIEDLEIPYSIVRGSGLERFQAAVASIEQFFSRR